MSETIKVHVETTADLSGVNAATEAVGKATTGLKAAGEAASEAAEKLDTGSKLADTAISKLAGIFPKFGALLGAFTGPLNLAFQVFELASEKLKKWNEELDAAGEKAAQHSDHVLELKDAQFEASKSSEALNIALQNSKTHYSDASEQAERLVRAIHGHAAAMAEIRDANEGAAIARINEMENKGQLSPAAAAAAREATQTAAAHEREHSKSQEELDVIAAHSAAANKARKDAPILESEAIAARTKTDNPLRNIKLKEADKSIEEATKDIPEAQKKFDAALEKHAADVERLGNLKALAALSPKPAGPSLYPSITTPQNMVGLQIESERASKEKFDQSEQALQKIKDRQADGLKTRQRLTIEKYEDEAAAKAAEEKAVRNNQAVTRETEASRDAASEHAENEEVRKAKRIAEERTNAAKAGLSDSTAPSGTARESLITQLVQKEAAEVETEKAFRDALTEVGPLRAEHARLKAEQLSSVKLEVARLRAEVDNMKSRETTSLNNGGNNG